MQLHQASVLCVQASGSSVLPFGLENENRLLAGVNALELTSQFTSYWRFKSIVEDTQRSAATIVLICIRQPDRHGQMGAVVCVLPRLQLQALLNLRLLVFQPVAS